MDIGDQKYVMLTTFTKDGRAKPTPIWVVPFDGGAAVWTVADSWKVKRIRNTPRVTLQGCDLRGTTLNGPVVEGTATVLDTAGSDRVRAAIVAKYGLAGRLTLLGSRLRRGKDATVGVSIATA